MKEVITNEEIIEEFKKEFAEFQHCYEVDKDRSTEEIEVRNTFIGGSCIQYAPFACEMWRFIQKALEAKDLSHKEEMREFYIERLQTQRGVMSKDQFL